MQRRDLQQWKQPAVLQALPFRTDNRVATRRVCRCLHGASWFLISGWYTCCACSARTGCARFGAFGHFKACPAGMLCWAVPWVAKKVHLTQPGRPHEAWRGQLCASYQHAALKSAQENFMQRCHRLILTSLLAVLMDAAAAVMMQNMQALPCTKGSFKAGINRVSSCTPCPAGLTTASTSALAQSACSFAEPGYMPMIINGTAVSVLPCPVGTFGPDGIQCFNCTDGMITQDPASTSPSDCTAPPGYGFYADGVGDGNPVTTDDLQALQQSVIRCPPGSWKVGLVPPCNKFMITARRDVRMNSQRVEACDMTARPCRGQGRSLGC